MEEQIEEIRRMMGQLEIVQDEQKEAQTELVEKIENEEVIFGYESDESIPTYMEKGDYNRTKEEKMSDIKPELRKRKLNDTKWHEWKGIHFENNTENMVIIEIDMENNGLYIYMVT